MTVTSSITRQAFSRSAVTILVLATACSTSTPDTAQRGSTRQAVQSVAQEDRDCDETATPIQVAAVLPTDLGGEPFPGFQDSVALTQFAFGGAVTVDTISEVDPTLRTTEAGG